MYRLSLILLVNLMLVMNAGAREVLRYWTVSEASTLEIHGSSNINNFTCGSGYFNSNSVLVEVSSQGHNFISGKILLDAKAFDCQNRIMNRDFQNTLKAAEYPEIKIEFLELKEVNGNGRTSQAEGWVEITIAGKKKKYPIVCEVKYINEHQNILTGKQIFRFSDFGLEAPQKAMGMVRVDNEINVEFRLQLEQATNLP
jgi:hypothetical protein